MKTLYKYAYLHKCFFFCPIRHFILKTPNRNYTFRAKFKPVVMQLNLSLLNFIKHSMFVRGILYMQEWTLGLFCAHALSDTDLLQKLWRLNFYLYSIYFYPPYAPKERVGVYCLPVYTCVPFFVFVLFLCFFWVN